MDHRSVGNLKCFAVVMPGLEAIAAEELRQLSAHEVAPVEGGVAFTTTMDGLFRINLRSRTVTRVLLRLAQFSALSFPELYNKCKKTFWCNYLHGDFEVRASCHRSKLMHSGRAEQAVRDAIAAVLLAGATTTTDGAVQQILLRIDNNHCTLSLDTSGERLDRRGYRLHSGRAPLRETMAAAMLQWMDWRSDEPLYTPMCGSGTFAIEAVWMAQKRAPGLDRVFPFLHWPALKTKRWQRALAKAQAMVVAQPACAAMVASDRDAGILAQAKANAAQAQVASMIRFVQEDVRQMCPPAMDGAVDAADSQAGLLICNPPYGDRIGGDAAALYAVIGQQFRDHFTGWRMAILAPSRRCEAALALPVTRRLKIKHGGKWVQLLHVETGAH